MTKTLFNVMLVASPKFAAFVKEYGALTNQELAERFNIPVINERTRKAAEEGTLDIIASQQITF